MRLSDISLALLPTQDTLTKEEQTKLILESLVDSLGLSETIELLSTVCHEKAIHISETWQDADLAREWSVFGFRLHRISTETKERKLCK